jgi:hypothetical protein
MNLDIIKRLLGETLYTFKTYNSAKESILIVIYKDEEELKRFETTDDFNNWIYEQNLKIKRFGKKVPSDIVWWETCQIGTLTSR